MKKEERGNREIGDNAITEDSKESRDENLV